jgi:hypothetical protein
MGTLKPTLFILDTPYQDCAPERCRSRSPSPLSLIGDDTENQEEEIYGLALMRRIISESYIRNASKLVITIPVIASPYADRLADASGLTSEAEGGADLGDGTARLDPVNERRAANTRMLRKCLDLGATDVMANPLDPKRINSLEVHAYRARLEAARDQKALVELRRGRKRSWVGISEEKPFSYLREAMVSKLMGRICRIGSEIEDVLLTVKLSISTEKQAEVTSAVGQWHFCAHDFTDDELVVAALLMFKHALSMPELEPWRIPTGTSAVSMTIDPFCCCNQLTAPTRPATPLPARLSGRLQHFRPISQLPPRGGCPAGDLPFPRQHWLAAAVPLYQWRGPPQVANGKPCTAV